MLKKKMLARCQLQNAKNRSRKDQSKLVFEYEKSHTCKVLSSTGDEKEEEMESFKVQHYAGAVWYQVCGVHDHSASSPTHVVWWWWWCASPLCIDLVPFAGGRLLREELGSDACSAAAALQQVDQPACP